MAVKSNAVFNHVLTKTASEFAVNEAEYAAPALAPVFPAAVQAATFPVWLRENMLTVPDLKARAPGAPYERLDMEIGNDTFATRDYGAEVALDDRQKAIYASAFDADRGKIQRGTRVLMLNKERRIHALVTGAGVPTSTPGTKWDQANADPIGDVDTVKEVIHDNCGMDPNVMVIPRDVFNILKELPVILDKIKYTQRGVITPELLAPIFGVSKIVIAGAVQNSAADGQALSIAKVWADSIVLAYVNSAIDIESPTFARTFAWNGYTKAGRGEIGVKTYRDDNANSAIHQLMHDVDEKLAAAACGYHLSDVLAA
ncbi:MAG: hypothetical protein AAGB14_00350 [Verrucomicrobiota bacterium]